MKFLSDILAKAGLTVDGVVTLNNTATGQTPNANDNSTKLATTAWVRTYVQPYSLPIASASVLGGIKVGSGLSIDAITGILTASATSVSTFRDKEVFTATAGQTTFTLQNTYTPGLLDVFVNGVYLNDDSYTASNGSTVVLDDAAALNDIVTFFIYSPYYVGETPNARNTCAFTATSGQTTFSCSYAVGSVDVFYNGSKLASSEFTAINGTSIVLATACVAGDYVEIVSWLVGGGISSSRTITIDGVTQDLSANRTWNILPTGGAAGDILAKVSGTNYDVTWIPNFTSTVQHTVKAAVALTKGQAVYVSSADGTNMIVSKASNISEATSSKTLGLVAQNLAINGQGFVVTEGLLAGLNTGTANAGDPVWLGTDGNLIYGLVNKPYAPDHLVFIGVVTRAQQNNGEIFVKVQNGFELHELHNVSALNPSDGDMIKYVASTGLWTKIAATTTNIAEGTNLYYTNTRVASYLTANSYNSGTGTTNYLPKFTGSTTIGNSNLINDASGNLGLGITPTNVSNYIRLQISGTTGGIFDLLSGNTRHFTIYNDSSSSVIGTVTNTPLIFQTNDGTKMTLAANGNLLVGTTTDNGARLQVSGTSTFGGRLLVSHATSGNYGAVIYNTSATGEGLVVRGGSTSSHSAFVVQPYDGSVSLFNVLSTGAATFISNVTTTGGFLQFPNNYGVEGRNAANTAHRTVLKLNSSNQIEIGRDTDISAIILGTASATNALTLASTGAATFSSSVTATGGFEIPNGQFYRARRSSGSLLTDMIGIPSGTDDVRLLTTGDFNIINGSLTNLMTVKNGGNVGIGTVSPNSKFEIQGSTSSPQFRISRSEQTNQGLTIQAGGGVTLLDSYDGTDTVFGSYTFNSTKGTNTVTRMRIDGSGNVGINTNNPSGQLSGTKGLSIVDSVNAAFGLSNGTNHWLNYLSGTTYRIWNNSVAEVMTLMYNGNVLIGTTSDIGTKLHVNGTTYSIDYIANAQGLNVSSFGFLSQTLSGQMTILGHNLRASNSVNNQVNVVNGGWFSSMIKMYYSEGITFHTSSTSYSAGAVYPIDATERIRIKSNGEVIFHNSIILRNGQINSLTSSDSGQSMYLNFQGNGTVFAGSSYAVLYAGSDERIKTEINHSQSTLTKILNLIPRTFKYKERPEVTNYGFIAQEVEVVMPELVRTSQGITMCLDEEIENQKSVESYGLAWASILVKAIQEQQLIIESLKSRIETLEQA